MPESVKSALMAYADQKNKAGELARFFQAYPGGYGEGDTFLGVKVPDQRAVAKKHYKQITLDEITLLLNENIHEYRLTALFICPAPCSGMRLKNLMKRSDKGF